MHKSLLNALLPTPCPMCGQHLRGQEVGVCASCLGQFQPVLEGNLLHFGTYGGRLERLVRALKFAEARNIALPMGKQLAQAVRGAAWKPNVVVPIPLHTARANFRGYNQAELLGKTAAFELGVPFLPALARVRATKQQARLSKTERLENIEGAFAAVLAVAGLEVLLVDDVHTSGSTLTEANLVLIEAGAKRVRMAVLARA